MRRYIATRLLSAVPVPDPAAQRRRREARDVLIVAAKHEQDEIERAATARATADKLDHLGEERIPPTGL